MKLGLKRKLISWLPYRVKEELFKKLLVIPQAEDWEDITIEVARSEKDVMAACGLIYEAYHAYGLCEDEKEPYRITKHALLPTTSIIVVKKAGEVIATLSVIADSAFGLPLESMYSVEPHRRKGERLVEVSTLAVSKKHRNSRGKILFPLMSYLTHYCKEFLGADAFVIATHPDVAPFYSALFGFVPLDGGKKKHHLVKDAWAYGQYMNLRTPCPYEASKNTFVGYGKKQKCVYDFFTQKFEGRYIFPKREFFKASDPGFSFQLLKKVFSKELKSLNELSVWEEHMLSQIYFYDEYKKIFLRKALGLQSSGVKHREEPRFWVNCPAKLEDTTSKHNQNIRITDISKNGIQFRTEQIGLPTHFKGTVRVQVGNKKFVTLAVKGVRKSGINYGAQIKPIKDAKVLDEFINYLDQPLRMVRKKSA